MKHHEVVKQAFRVLVGLVAIAATFVLLVADSSVKCPHERHAQTFDVAGTCGPSGLVKLSFSESDDSCVIEGTGLDAVGLPGSVFSDGAGAEQKLWLRDGRFHLEGRVDPALRSPDAGAGHEDAGASRCVDEADAGSSACSSVPDGGEFTWPEVTCRRASEGPELRFECSGFSPSLSGGSAPGPYCEAVLTPR